MRLCANTGCLLHLIQPLGFSLDAAKLRRAGLDYRDQAGVQVHDHLAAFYQCVQPLRVFTLSTKGCVYYTQAAFKPGDALVFGSETEGLSEAVRHSVPPDQRLCIPMQAQSRSLNLSNAVAVVTYEAWRQCQFHGAAPVVS